MIPRSRRIRFVQNSDRGAIVSRNKYTNKSSSFSFVQLSKTRIRTSLLLLSSFCWDRCCVDGFAPPNVVVIQEERRHHCGENFSKRPLHATKLASVSVSSLNSTLEGGNATSYFPDEGSDGDSMSHSLDSILDVNGNVNGMPDLEEELMLNYTSNRKAANLNVKENDTETSLSSSSRNETQGLVEPGENMQMKITKAVFSKKQEKQFLKKLWRKRHAGSINQGIRRTEYGLREILNDQDILMVNNATEFSRSSARNQYVSRTLTGLIMALAGEAEGLHVQVHSRPETPIWDKYVDTIRIDFTRLGFKPLSMGGLCKSIPTSSNKEIDDKIILNDESVGKSKNTNETLFCADEAFDKIDVDKSGALDQAELTTALGMAMVGGTGMSSIPKSVIGTLAGRLLALYDTNGDQVIDRAEYRLMVEDMAALRKAEKKRTFRTRRSGVLKRIYEKAKNLVRIFRFRKTNIDIRGKQAQLVAGGSEDKNTLIRNSTEEKFSKPITGSITLSDLKMDLRQFVFGVIPGLKRVTPGGPLVLEPFTMTVKGSFNRYDLMNSFLLDAGLRRLVARALRLRVRSIRDFFDGAIWYGRQWNMASAEAPIVEVPQLTDIEFDKEDRVIITGIAQIRTSPGSPTIENSFRLRTRIGTRENGQVIRLQDPEIAILLEIPKPWERNIVSVCERFNLPIPARPKPISIFVPLVQIRKFQNKDGYDLGEDNCIKSIGFKDSAMQIEMSAVIRPGRFLGSHYIAFSVPQRTFIVTNERVRNGIREARRNAIAARREQEEMELYSFVDTEEILNERFSFIDPEDKNEPSENVVDEGSSNFFEKFLRGYTSAKFSEGDDWGKQKDAVVGTVSEWFGRQSARIAPLLDDSKDDPLSQL